MNITSLLNHEIVDWLRNTKFPRKKFMHGCIGKNIEEAHYPNHINTILHANSIRASPDTYLQKGKRKLLYSKT
jgi:hypothetical protein